jgi:hypothetical protein
MKGDTAYVPVGIPFLLILHGFYVVQHLVQQLTRSPIPNSYVLLGTEVSMVSPINPGFSCTAGNVKGNDKPTLLLTN